MIRRNRITRRTVSSIGLAAVFLGLAATPALGVPVFEVDIARDAAVVSHSDERVLYTVKVKNIAPAAPVVAGDTLRCNPETWEGAGAPTFAYQWLRNGAAIAGQTATTYTTTAPADEGKAIQCQVRATNTIPDVTNPAVFVGSTRVTGAIVVDPQPGTAPPVPPAIAAPAVSNGGTTLNGTGSRDVTCNAGTAASWGPNPPTEFTFQWYRNGIAFGAPVTTPASTTSTKITLSAAEQSPPATFQCTVTGTNAGGAVTLASANRATVNPPAPGGPLTPNPGAPSNNNTLAIAMPNDISGPVTFELELPGGEQTYVHSALGVGWSCETVPALGAQPAKAICSRCSVLKPQASYPDIVVVVALGSDAPDHAIVKATIAGGGTTMAASSVDEFTFTPIIPFGLTLFETGVFDELGDDYTQAGGHPFSGIGEFEFPVKRLLVPTSHTHGPVAQVKQVFTDLPRGLVGNALASPELCPSTLNLENCPSSSIVGGIKVEIAGGGEPKASIYAIEPEVGTPAQFAFLDVFKNTYTLSARLRPEDNYAVSLDLAPAPRVNVLESTVTVCGYGGKREGSQFGGCKEAGEPDPDGPGPLTGANPKPLFTNPTRCEAANPPTVRVRLNSWQDPDHFAEAEDGDPANTGCEKVEFEPAMELDPTSAQADSPTGLDVSLTMPTNGLEGKDDEGNLDPDALSQANLKRARITFPEGMAVNASAGHGLGSCSAEQVKLKTNDPISCPDSSKIGTIEIDTPLIKETLKGATYIAKQGDVDGALIGLYLVFESKKDGIIVKLPARVELNPRTGQLVTIVDESPEAPFSAVRMHFPGGPGATLLTPPKCGTYEIKAELSSWATSDPSNPTPSEIVTDTSSFEVTEGPNGAPCPEGKLDPKLNAGSTNPQAGAKTPFTMRLHREDGTQRFNALELTPPRGLVADLRGIPYCPDEVLASISGDPETGQGQIDSPSCPAASLIGTATAGAGGGPNPFYVETGKAYLAGPYKGAPLSIAVVTPAVAGPLDLGTVVVRNAVHIDPVTAKITVKSDPIPTILHGILLDIRDIRVAIDRPNFTQNPTNCEEMAVAAKIGGAGQDVADPGDDASAEVSNRFQAGGCEALGFKPRIALSLKGGTKRGDNPALKAVVRPRVGDANIKRAAVTLPRSAFLDQGHIRTICTRVQWAQDSCPKAAIYGYAEAVTPLLDEPLKGPVYLRSSDNKLPDLVTDLRGPAHQPIRVEASFRTDSIKGGIRSTIDLAPDAPVTKFVLQMQGGKKSLIVNSQNLCAKMSRANARLTAQNGRKYNSRPKVVAVNCKKQRAAKTMGMHRRHR